MIYDFSQCGDLEVHTACVQLFQLTLIEVAVVNSLHQEHIVGPKGEYAPRIVFDFYIMFVHGSPNAGEPFIRDPRAWRRIHKDGL